MCKKSVSTPESWLNIIIINVLYYIQDFPVKGPRWILSIRFCDESFQFTVAVPKASGLPFISSPLALDTTKFGLSGMYSILYTAPLGAQNQPSSER